MKFVINGYEYILNKHMKADPLIRTSFNKLAQATFGLDFESWYQNGHWGDDYIPYALIHDGNVVANVSVNIIRTKWGKDTKTYIQLGTVMTDKAHRGKGLSRWLMEQVLSDWKDRCDAMYLFANDSVVDFYPKFGFEKAMEYQCEKLVPQRSGAVKKLDMSKDADRNLLLECYHCSNPFSALPMEHNVGLLMFYCTQLLKECVYYLEEFEAVVIGDHDGDELVCYDIFCGHEVEFDMLLGTLATHVDQKLVLGFMPKQTIGFTIGERHQEDTTLFLLKGKENLFKENKLMFPLLSHA